MSRVIITLAFALAFWIWYEQKQFERRNFLRLKMARWN